MDANRHYDKGEIANEIERVCENHDLVPLCAREMGSRMTNSTHDESDHDVMFLFVQSPTRHYIDHAVETIEDHHIGPDERLDLSGWDIEKFARYLGVSNPTAVEFTLYGKPVLSWHNETWEAVQMDIRQSANLMALYHHYISMARGNYNKYVKDEDESDGNRQFHVARATAMAAYIRENDDVPPGDVTDIMVDESVPFDIRFRLAFLYRLRTLHNGDFQEPDRVGNMFAKERDRHVEATDDRTKRPDSGLLDDLIRDAIKGPWQKQNTTARPVTHTSE